MRRFRLHPASFVVFALLVSACGGNNNATPPTAPPVHTQTPIKHVVILIQENRSFDNLFYQYPGADSNPPIPLSQITFEAGQDVCHFHSSFVSAYDGGKMDGWSNEQTCGFGGGAYGPTGVSNYMEAYVSRAEVQPYWNLAQRYTLADHMFQSNTGPSFPAHQYLIAAQSDDVAEVPSASPWGCDAPAGTTAAKLNADGTESPGPFPCFDYASLADELDAASLSWKDYSPPLSSTGGIWSAFDAIKSIRYGGDWDRNVISPETQILKDVPAGKLADVTWVTPAMPNSDHPLGKSNTGPDWVTSVVNTIGNSKFWNSTVIFIVWDDWGGWYDHVKPPQLDNMGLGFRVPLLVVSPYAKTGYVSHTQHEFGSILKFIEYNFDLPALAQADKRADNLLDCFDFTRTTTFSTLPAKRSASFFLRQREVPGPNDPV